MLNRMLTALFCAVIAISAFAVGGDCPNCPKKLEGLPSDNNTSNISKISDNLTSDIPELTDEELEYAIEMLCYGARSPALPSEQGMINVTYFEEELLLEAGFGTTTSMLGERENPFVDGKGFDHYRPRVQAFWNKYYSKITCDKEPGMTYPAASLLAQVAHFYSCETFAPMLIDHLQLDLNVKDKDGMTIIDWIDYTLKNDIHSKLVTESLIKSRAFFTKHGAKTSAQLATQK